MRSPATPLINHAEHQLEITPKFEIESTEALMNGDYTSSGAIQLAGCSARYCTRSRMKAPPRGAALARACRVLSHARGVKTEDSVHTEEPSASGILGVPRRAHPARRKRCAGCAGVPAFHWAVLRKTAGASAAARCTSTPIQSIGCTLDAESHAPALPHCAKNFRESHRQARGTGRGCCRKQLRLRFALRATTAESHAHGRPHCSITLENCIEESATRRNYKPQIVTT